MRWQLCVCGETGGVVEAFLAFENGVEVEVVSVTCVCGATWDEVLEFAADDAHRRHPAGRRAAA